MTSDSIRDDVPEIVIRDDPDEHAYVIDVDGVSAGKAVYHLRGGRHFFVHTEISPEFERQGLGRRLVEYALNDVRDHGGTVVPICPFFAAYIKRHEEYQPLVDQEIMARIEKKREQ